MSDIVVLGSLNMDLYVTVPRAPGPGETLTGDDFRIMPGGKGANQAAAAARLGGRVSMVGRVGADGFGQQMAANLQAQGVDVAHVGTDAQAPSGTAVVMLERSGENRIVVIPGANGRVDRSDVDAAEATIRGARLLLMQLEVPLETVAHALQVAARHGVPVIFNPAPAIPLSRALLSQVYCLVLNESEARILMGSEVTNLASARAAAEALRNAGVPVVILTLGERGAYLAGGEEEGHVPTRAVDVVDTTAAGDAFVGGLAASLVRGLPLLDAVRFANAAGTLAVTRYGSQASLPSADEVAQFLAAEGPTGLRA